MIEARADIMTATGIELPFQAQEDHQAILDTLALITPPRESERALAKYAVQRSLRLPFTKDQHIAVASEETEGRSWGKRVMQVFAKKFGNVEGFCLGDLETEALMMDLETTIWD